MSNASSVAGFVGAGTIRNTFPLQTVAATAETILKINTDTSTSNFFLVAPSGGNVYGAQTSLDPRANASITAFSGREYGLPSGETVDEFNSGSWIGHPFKVRVVGTGTAGHNAGQTVLFNLYCGTSATLGSDKIIGTTGSAYAVAAGASNVSFDWMIEATLQWSASNLVSGWYTANVAGGTTSQIVAPTVLPNLPAVTTTAGLSFLATVTMGNAASSTVQITEFVIDEL